MTRSAALPLLLFLAMVGLFAVMLTADRNPKEIKSARVGSALPAFEIASLRNGDPALTQTTLGHTSGQPVLVNFFASWCVPCRAEHDALMHLSQEMGLEIVGVAYKDAPDDSRAFIAELGDPYGQIGMDLKGRVGIDFGISGVPETFIVTPDGQVTYRHWGPIVGNAVEAKLVPALKAAGWSGIGDSEP